VSRYKYGRSGTGTSSKAEKSKTAFRVSTITAILLIPAIIYIIISTLPPNPVTGKSVDKERFDPTITFTTDWFTFTAPNRWEEAADQHVKDKVYVYREKNGGEYLGLLRIFVNNSPVNFQDMYTRVLPIRVEDGNTLKPSELQPHCSEQTLSKQRIGDPFPIVQGEVSFTCWVDNENLIATAGEIGGGTAIKLRRENGSVAEYRMVYSNTAFTPSESSFEQVLKAFTAK
jgi:hypothetical protein